MNKIEKLKTHIFKKGVGWNIVRKLNGRVCHSIVITDEKMSPYRFIELKTTNK
jgi:hypothetical protein